MKKSRSVALTPELIERIDRDRGPISFSAYLEFIAWKGLRGRP